MSVFAAILVPIMIQALVILAAHGVPQASTLPGSELLGPLAPYAPQVGAIAVGLIVMSRQFGAWTVAFSALYIPGMLQVLQWLMLPMVTLMGYPTTS